jgi:hypothetical protein
MANKYNKKREVRNKSKDWLTDYYQTGREWEKDNRRRREEAGEKEEKGLRNLNSFELGCIVIIVLALIGMFIKYFLLGHGFWTTGI